MGFSGSLATSLRRMREDGVIDDRLWAWSDLLRQVGNQGAHDLDGVVTSEDVEDAIWFARQVIHQVFVMQPRFKNLAHRRLRGGTSQLRLVGGGADPSIGGESGWLVARMPLSGGRRLRTRLAAV